MKSKPAPATGYIKHNQRKKTENQYSKQLTKIRVITGFLLYACTHARPDITYCKNYHSDFQLEPNEEMPHYIFTILQYINCTINKGMIFRGTGTDNKITAYTGAPYSSGSY